MLMEGHTNIFKKRLQENVKHLRFGREGLLNIEAGADVAARSYKETL